MVEDLPDWPASTLLEHAVWWHRKGNRRPPRGGRCPGGAPRRHAPAIAPATCTGNGVPIVSPTCWAPGTDLERRPGSGRRVRRTVAVERTDAGAWRRAFRLACLNGRRETARLLCPDGWFDKDALVDALLRGRHLLTWDEGETAWDWARFQLEHADPLNVLTFAELPRNDAISQAATPSRVGVYRRSACGAR